MLLPGWLFVLLADLHPQRRKGKCSKNENIVGTALGSQGGTCRDAELQSPQTQQLFTSKGTMGITAPHGRMAPGGCCSAPLVSFIHSFCKNKQTKISKDLLRLSCNHRVASAVPSFCTEEETRLWDFFFFFRVKSLKTKLPKAFPTGRGWGVERVGVLLSHGFSASSLMHPGTEPGNDGVLGGL